MRILLITFYFPPDLSAGSFRADALVRALCANLGLGHTVDVCTAQPNRYRSYSQLAAKTERKGDVSINRFSVQAHASGMMDQSRSYVAFAYSVWQHTRNRDYDVVIATSGRLMSAVLGSMIARRNRIPLFLDIRDIFLETICDVLPKYRAFFLRPAISLLEHFAIRRASWVNLVSPGFREYFCRRYPRREFSFYTNGIDDTFIGIAPAPPADSTTGTIQVVYAGNFGESQGLHYIIPELAQHTFGRMHFTLIGDGSRKAALVAALHTAGVSNVTVREPMARHELLAAYQKADVLFLHLADRNVFRTVLPSKMFEYAATGKPLWAGVAGTAAKFVENEIMNAAVFEPHDVASALAAFARLELTTRPRVAFVAKFSRNNIMDKMAKEIRARILAASSSQSNKLPTARSSLTKP